MTADAVQLHVVHPHGEVDGKTLSPDERRRAESFHFREDALRWISYRTSLRLILASALGLPPEDVPIQLSHSGKPELCAPFGRLHFNLSHTNDLAIVALSTSGPVGIDLEPKGRAGNLLECEASFCHPLEVANLPLDPVFRQDHLLRLWTMKEAVLKAVGTGLLIAPESIRIERGTEERHYHAVSPVMRNLFESQRIQQVDHPMFAGYQVSVSAVVKRLEIADSGASTTDSVHPTITNVRRKG